MVDLRDVGAFIGLLRENSPRADLNGDGVVDAADIRVMVEAL